LVQSAAQPTTIGFPGARAALNYYLQELGHEGLRWHDNVQIRAETGDGIDVAFGVGYNKHYDVWEFLRYHIRSDPEHPVPLLPGLCVHGIRVSDNPVGYRVRGILAIANVTGPMAPRTNVARSDVEATEELRHTYNRVYEAFARHVGSEFERLRTGGTGLIRAAHEADILAEAAKSAGTVEDWRGLNKAFAALPIIATENENGYTPVSHADLDAVDHIWTIDSPLLRHVEGIVVGLNINLATSEMIHRLESDRKLELQYPRLLGRTERVLEEREISGLWINSATQQITVRWERNTGRWLSSHELAFRLRRLGTPVDRYEREHRRRFNNIYLLRAALPEVDCGDFYAVTWRGSLYCLANCPLSRLGVTLGDTEQLYKWIMIATGETYMSDMQLLALREDLVGKDTSGLGPLEDMAIQHERVFSMRDLLRSLNSEVDY